MSLIHWKPKKNLCSTQSKSQVPDIFDWDHPFWGLSLYPSSRSGFPGIAEDWVPAIDVSEDKNAVHVKADVPGLRKEDIQVSVDHNVLTIRGERKTESENKEKSFHRIERSYGLFERRFDLGVNVDASKIKAKYRDGVLEVTLPKSESSQEHKIPIDS